VESFDARLKNEQNAFAKQNEFNRFFELRLVTLTVKGDLWILCSSMGWLYFAVGLAS